MNEQDYYLICDTETSGLDPTTAQLLEVGIVIADANYNVVWEHSWLYPGACGAAVEAIYLAAHPKVQEMHTKNGLWAELYQGTQLTTGQMCDQVVQALAQIGVSKNSRADMTNRNPGFDLKFLNAYAKPIADCFSYHLIDICTMQLLVQRKHGKDAKWSPPEDQPHRALGDARNALEELKYYCSNFMV